MPKNKGHNKGRAQVVVAPPRGVQVESPPDAKPVGRRSTVVQFESYSGILPRPDHLERFEALLPGATDRYLKLAEKQSVHRQGMERGYLHYNGISQVAGVIFAGLALLGGIGGGIWLLGNDKSIAGFGTLITAIGSAIGVYRWGQKTSAAERSDKAAATRR